jgi:REP element-mobilizing transposase RayT
MHPVRKLNRLQGYDYRRNALYFVTSCVQDRVKYFGKIEQGKMILNEFGKIAERQFNWLQGQYVYVILHSFVIMPNHVHAIIEIDDTIVEQCMVKIKSLSELIGAYKTTTSKQIHLIEMTSSDHIFSKPFAWQRSFHDHIIRDEEALLRISNYIENNPVNWKEDKLYI